MLLRQLTNVVIIYVGIGHFDGDPNIDQMEGCDHGDADLFS